MADLRSSFSWIPLPSTSLAQPFLGRALMLSFSVGSHISIIPPDCRRFFHCFSNLCLLDPLSFLPRLPRMEHILHYFSTKAGLAIIPSPVS